MENIGSFLLENVGSFLSIIASILSIFMFFLTRNEKKECINIKNQITQELKILNKNTDYKSSDQYNINKVDNFDNSKRF